MKKPAKSAWQVLLAFSVAASLALGDAHAIKPRSSVDNYHSRAQQNGIGVGAELLSAKQVSKIFSFDVNRCCVVVEVGFYPQKDGVIEVVVDDFSLTELNSDLTRKPESASTVARAVATNRGTAGWISAETTTGVGYESGTRVDPVTGQETKVHGVYTIEGAKASAGNRRPEGPAEGNEVERAEKELKEKSLPQGKAVSPVGGYLYFRVARAKKDAKYRLEYAAKGDKMVLMLP